MRYENQRSKMEHIWFVWIKTEKYLFWKMWDNPIFTIYKIYLIKFAAWTFRERWFTWGLSRFRKVRIWVCLQPLIFFSQLFLLLWGKRFSLFSFVWCLCVLCWVCSCLLLCRLMRLFAIWLLLINRMGPFLIRWLRLYLTSRLRLFLILFLFCVLGLFLVPVLFLVCCL